MGKLVVEREVAIAAPVEVVWSVLTEPRHTRAWAGAFGASDPRMQPASGDEADDILQRYELSEVAGGTRLRTAHGDFAKLARGAEIHARVGPIWERLLARLKELAERCSDGP